MFFYKPYPWKTLTLVLPTVQILYNNANKRTHTHQISFTFISHTHSSWFTAARFIRTRIVWAVLTTEHMKLTGRPAFSVPHNTAAINNKPFILPPFTPSFQSESQHGRFTNCFFLISCNKHVFKSSFFSVRQPQIPCGGAIRQRWQRTADVSLNLQPWKNYFFNQLWMICVCEFMYSLKCSYWAQLGKKRKGDVTLCTNQDWAKFQLKSNDGLRAFETLSIKL